MPATTLAGLQVRALILAEIAGYGENTVEQDEDDCTDQLMIRAIVRYLSKMTV